MCLIFLRLMIIRKIKYKNPILHALSIVTKVLVSAKY